MCGIYDRKVNLVFLSEFTFLECSHIISHVEGHHKIESFKQKDDFFLNHLFHINAYTRYNKTKLSVIEMIATTKQ